MNPSISMNNLNEICKMAGALKDKLTDHYFYYDVETDEYRIRFKFAGNFYCELRLSSYELFMFNGNIPLIASFILDKKNSHINSLSVFDFFVKSLKVNS